MKNLALIFVCCMVLIVSCDQSSSDNKALQMQNDSLMLENKKTTAEMEGLLSLLNEVEDNFASIKAAENYLMVQSVTGGEMTPTIRERLTDDMKLITEILNKNKTQIGELENQLKNSNIKSSQFQKTITRLQTELNQKTETLVALQSKLAEKDLQIAELSESVSALSADVNTLKVQTEQQMETIAQQESTINTAFYCFGTSKELKDQKILQKGELSSNFNKDYFTKIKDINKFEKIDLFAKKAKLITKHPDGSYEMKKDESGNLMFMILDAKNFWSLGKYLVIEVK